jgi:lipopolysaccharide transport system ATP-binding protein
MSNIVIKVENLSKQYQLGQVGTGTLSHDLNRWFSRIRGREDPTLKIGQENILSSPRTSRLAPHSSDFVWALRDINFEVTQGEVLGIIGKNGAGKSTLLKILSQVTSPTTGIVKVKGRLASLLEVGTGFHSELSGRENIFLNGAILGMTKSEIRNKFDEIVDFSGIEKYIDTPVKRYSSGMYVRLAFAVAAHLDPEILVVDEVLAVGDAEFQKKAIGKMQDVSKEEGRTVLFVSHNMAAIQGLCNRCLLLKEGQITENGSTKLIIEKYFNDNTRDSFLDFKQRKDRSGNHKIEVSSFYLLNKENQRTSSIICGEKVLFVLEINNPTKEHFKNIVIALGIDNYLGNRIIHLSNDLISKEIIINPGLNQISFSMDKITLVPGDYYITYFCSINGDIADWLPKAICFTVNEGDYYNNGKMVKEIMGTIHADFNIKVGQDNQLRNE